MSNQQKSRQRLGQVKSAGPLRRLFKADFNAMRAAGISRRQAWVICQRRYLR